MRERGELPMEHQNLNQEQKLQVILCGPLPKTERALLRRGDVEIIRDDDNFRSCTNSRSIQIREPKLPMARQKIAGILCVFQDFFTRLIDDFSREDVC